MDINSLEFIAGALSGGVATSLGTYYGQRISLPKLSLMPQNYNDVNRFWLSRILGRLGYRVQNPFKLKIQPWITCDTSIIIKAEIGNQQQNSKFPKKVLIKVAHNAIDPSEIILNRRLTEVSFSQKILHAQSQLPIAQIYDSNLAQGGKLFYILMEDPSHLTLFNR